MKRQTAIGALVVILVITVFVHARVAAQEPYGSDQGLIGSWNLEVTLRDCNSGAPFVSFLAMNTYNQGGTLHQTAVPGPESSASPGHGIWSHQTGRNYSAAFRFFSFNPDGSFAGKVIVRSTIELGQGGNEYTSTDTAEILNPNGDLLFRACSTSTATRFK